MSSAIQDANGAGLVAFLQWAAEKGVMKAATANSYRAAVNKVLEIDDDWESLDIRGLDIDSQLDRFGRLSGSNYTPGSLSTYRTRFKKSVEMYREYLDDPSSFKVSVRERSGRGTNGREASAVSDRPSAGQSSSAGEPQDRELIVYPFPLRSGATAYLHLPRELPSAEVERLSAFLGSIAIDAQLSLPAAPHDGS